MSVGAQPSDSVKRLLEQKGMFERFDQYKAGELTPGEAVEADAQAAAPA
jgi:ribosomal protein S16